MGILDLLYPRHCLSCGFLGTYLCPDCIKLLVPLKQQACFYCGGPSPWGITHAACSSRGAIAAGVFLYRYNPVLKKAVKSLKYRLARDAFGEVIPLLFNTGGSALSFARIWQALWPQHQFVLQPIPLHESRLRERGFNQAQSVADRLAAYTGWRQTDAVRRKKYTATQAQQESRSDRRRNLSGAFAANPSDRQLTSRNSFVVLVDDVVTSGITAGEAARSIAGQDAPPSGKAPRVGVFALAKG